jgi:hypothetical protein
MFYELKVSLLKKVIEMYKKAERMTHLSHPKNIWTVENFFGCSQTVNH